MTETEGQKAFRRGLLNALAGRCVCGRRKSQKFQKCCKLCGGTALLNHTSHCDKRSA